MKRYILVGTALVAVILAVVFVFGRSNAGEIEEHGFYGIVTYSNCECGQGAFSDEIHIQELPDGVPDVYYSLCRNNEGWYDTEEMASKVYAPGNYKIWLVLKGSDCETSSIKYVTHGYSKQQVDLSASSPSGGS